MRTWRKTKLKTLVHDGANLKMKVDLPHDTAILALVFDIEADVDIAGAVIGAVTLENPLTMVKDIRIFDDGGVKTEVEPRALRQIHERRGFNPLSGVALASTAVQTIHARQQVVLPFFDRWSARPSDCFLKPVNPDNYYAEIEWVGTAAAALKAAFGTGGAGVITITNAQVTISAIHDRELIKRVAPLFIPRLLRKTFACPGVSDEYEVEIKTGNFIRYMLLHALDSDVTSEAVIERLSLKNDAEPLIENIDARSWHEFEQFMFGGVTDDAGLGLGYFFEDFADNGKLGQMFSPYQGGNPRWVLKVNGAATKQVRLYTMQYERTPGLVAAKLPDGLV